MRKVIFLLLFSSIAFSLAAQHYAKSKTISLYCDVDVTLSKGYSISKIFVLNDDNFLFSHNSSTGKTVIWNLDVGGDPVLTAQWSEGWTNINFYEYDGEVYFFHQKENKGTAYINKLDYGKIMSGKGTGERVYESKWSKGWSATKFFVHNDIIYFFHYKKGTGLARLNASTKGGDLGKRIYEKNWSKGYTNFAMAANSGSFYMLYQKENEGTCVINRVNLPKLEQAVKAGFETPNLGEEAYRKKWSKGWGNISFFNLKNNVYMFHNKPGNGLARISKLNANGTVGEKVYDKYWSEGWTNIDIFYRNRIPRLFHQKSKNGKTKICKLEF